MVEPVRRTVVSAMERLYAVEPEEFLAARKRLAGEAKVAGDGPASAEIGRLRKPSLAAWAVNLVAREESQALSALLRVGEQLRAAQARLDVASLQSLRPDRDAAVDGFVAAGVAVLAARDRPLRGAAQQEVRDTAIAAIADAGASVGVASGQLVKALSYSGFGEVDLSDAVARTSSGAILTVLPGAADQVAADGTGARAAASATGAASASAAPAATAAAVAAVERAEREAQDAERVAAAARAERIAGAEAALAKAELALADAEAAVTQARRALRGAERARKAAAAELTSARRR